MNETTGIAVKIEIESVKAAASKRMTLEDFIARVESAGNKILEVKKDRRYRAGGYLLLEHK